MSSYFIKKLKVGFFRFKKLKCNYLLTNDAGEFAFLAPASFDAYLAGKLEKLDDATLEELKNKHFIRDHLDFEGLAQKYAKRNSFLWTGPNLHIIVVTLRCDHGCRYCQSGAKNLSHRNFDMDRMTAQKVVDSIFESPNPNLVIEFQGGEPLANWDIVKLVIEYAKSKNKNIGKKILFSLVSNLSFMTNERLNFLLENNVTLCTSLDGPTGVHNKNRIVSSNKKRGGSHRNTTTWIRLIQDEMKKKKSYRFRINALTTITKASLPFHKEIVDEFLDLQLDRIFLRPINPFGLDKKTWSALNVTAKEFLEFYENTLNYIIDLNIPEKIIFLEKTAQIFLRKILLNEDANFLDLRSPCGAGIGQLAYNYNGDVYTCDEARMLAATNDHSFRIGNVKEGRTYQEMMNSEVVKTLCMASCLETLPSCSQCVYQPYCGVCPLYNYALEGDIFSKIPHNQRCQINMGILDFLFEKIENGAMTNKVFSSWVQ